MLCERSIGFHNGGTGATAAEDDARTTNSGSNWARGASGVGVEFDSVYDGSFFANVTELDYCSPSGFSDPQKKNLDQSSTWCEGLAVTANHGGHDPLRVLGRDDDAARLRN